MKRSVKRARLRELEEKISSLKQTSVEEEENKEEIHDEFLSKFTTNTLGQKRLTKAAEKANAKENEEVTDVFKVVEQCGARSKVMTHAASQEFLQYRDRQSAILKCNLDRALTIGDTKT